MYAVNPTQPASILERIFALDLRSLSVFRIALGLLILVDLAVRWPTLTAMYTSDGLFSQPLSFEYYRSELGPQWYQFIWSLYWLSDSVAFVTALFIISAIAAVFLVVGKWTRIATILSWILLVSLHTRNPLITTSGDFLFKMMLFWSIFLPLGARWSLDARKMNSTLNPTSTAITSMATIGYVFQLFASYFFPGIAKWNEIWFQGDAMWYVLRLDIYITEFGRALLEYPGLLSVISWVTLVAEVFWIWTLFSPWKNGWYRIINMVLFWAFHIGIGLSMTIGLFPWICLIAWLPLLPSFVWARKPADAAASSWRRWNALSWPQLAGQLFCSLALLLVVVWNVSNIDSPVCNLIRSPLVAQLGYQMGISQHFQMFGIPPAENPWFVYEAQLVDGTKIDIFRNREIDLNRPEWGRRVFPNFHWRKLHRNLLHQQNAFVRQPLLDYAVKKWDAEHGVEQQVVRARLLFFKEDIGPSYNSSNFVSQVWGSYTNQSNSAGSLFDSLADEFEEKSF